MKLSGARPIVMDISAPRLAFVSATMGVADTILAAGNESDVKSLANLTNGQLADAVVDATGSNKSMVRALDFASFAGRVVFVGITQQNLDLPHAPVLHRRELTLLASRNAPSADFPHIIGLIEKGRIDTEPWITHHASFEEVPGVFPNWLKPETRVIKAIVTSG